MTESQHAQRRPPACHYDRALGERVTREHRDDCPNPSTHGGCAPCTAPHCVVCGREHLDNDHPLTCPSCIGKVRDDLADIQTSYANLATEALEAGADGRLVAAAPIPGGTAAVLIGPTVRLDLMRVARGYNTADMAEVHHRKDPLPPLAVLAQWEDMWRAWFGLARGRRRATIGAAIDTLRDHATDMAQTTDGPDWLTFTQQIRTLRSNLERALHDEQEPEQGVECFECGDKLVRRFRPAAACRHDTPARLELGFWARLGYPEALGPRDVRAARMPCGRCSQGGLDDPRAGLSWECPGCRKEYDPGEYARAMRLALMPGGSDGDGWTHVTMASDAAADLTGHVVPAATIRKWMDRGKVAAMCVWRCEELDDGTLVPVRWGLRLAFWPDVADAAVASARRSLEAELARRRRAAEYAAWVLAVVDGEDRHEAGARLEIHPARVEAFILEEQRIGA